MSYEVINHPGFTVAGPSIKTDNTKAAQDLAVFWDQVFKSNILKKIPHRTGNYVYGVYSDFSNIGNSKDGFQQTGYSLTAGLEVDGAKEFPEGIAVRHIPEGKYAVFTAKKPEDILSTWIEIWETKEFDDQRSFKFDFEQYGAENDEIKIFIGLK